MKPTGRHQSLPLAFGTLLLLLTVSAQPCEWVQGYFHQVTTLRGTVVGADRGDPRGWMQWSRHMVKRGHATLKLIDFNLYTKTRGAPTPFKQVNADDNGYFDFGALPAGHYELEIDVHRADWGGDKFDVEIASGAKPNKSVLIDVSPINPDCTGGHQFYAFAK